MKYRQLGKTGIQISEIGFGAWGIGGWGARDDPEARRALSRAFDVAASDGIMLDEAVLRRLKEHAFNHGWNYPWIAG